MSAPRIAALAGDAIGPEIVAATRQTMDAALAAAGTAVAWLEVTIGFDALNASGSTLPDAAYAAIADCDGIVLGPVSHNDYPPRDRGGLNPSGELRRRLDLYANVRPARTRAGIPPAAGQPLDLVIMRENTEGFYADRNMASGPGELMPTEDLAISLRKVTRAASLRIAEAAFEAARARKGEGRAGRVTAVHKANVLRMSDGLFLACTREVAARYKDIAYDERLVDAMCAHLVRRPGEYDVVVTTNMFGDILSDLASELAGGLGLAASLNVGATIAMAQAQHGSAPDLAGRDVANPSSLIGSGAMLLDWLGRTRQAEPLLEAARLLERALDATLSDPSTRTPDLGGSIGTAAFARAVCAHIEGGGR